LEVNVRMPVFEVVSEVKVAVNHGGLPLGAAPVKTVSRSMVVAIGVAYVGRLAAAARPNNRVGMIFFMGLTPGEVGELAG
jgi:hypothetical protein